MKALQLAGQRFGHLVVVERADGQIGKSRWRCRCDCGGETISTGGNLVSGGSQSCGCVGRARAAEAARHRSTTHGHASRVGMTSEYRSWTAMHGRCKYPSVNDFDRYGGRGIMVCDRWSSFEAFFADMGTKPTPPAYHRSYQRRRELRAGKLSVGNAERAGLKQEAAMNAIPLDFSPEHAHDRCQRARLAFLAAPCRATGDIYWERAFRFWKALNRSSAGWERAGAELDRAIKRAIEMYENRAGRVAGGAPEGTAIMASFQPRRPRT